MLKTFWRNERGGGEALSFAAIAIILAFFVLAMVEPIHLSRTSDKINGLARYALVLAESQGELSSQALQDVRSRAVQLGLEVSELEIDFRAFHDDGTEKLKGERAEYGERIGVQLSYTKKYDRVTLTNFVLASESKTAKISSPAMYSVSTSHKR
ncbi:TadE/TadG family type IV pilus assembly protein [Heliorestis convoluta]|uniref:DUF4320 family protein n=1 Tax=Heliorestis convoluta TaxID=356322 RepID=A0A5Q2MX55_9FIRM|nr:hypothetical protein [Heliorestis convoluta]QGG46361.1 hypothetical protein FTV88_0182 [Heliorestis convoluta]